MVWSLEWINACCQAFGCSLHCTTWCVVVGVVVVVSLAGLWLWSSPPTSHLYISVMHGMDMVLSCPKQYMAASPCTVYAPAHLIDIQSSGHLNNLQNPLPQIGQGATVSLPDLKKLTKKAWMWKSRCAYSGDLCPLVVLYSGKFESAVNSLISLLVFCVAAVMPPW